MKATSSLGLVNSGNLFGIVRDQRTGAWSYSGPHAVRSLVRRRACAGTALQDPANPVPVTPLAPAPEPTPKL